MLRHGLVLFFSTIIVAVATPPAQAQAKKVTRDILNKITPGWGDKFLKKHDVVPPTRLKNGKYMFVLALRDEGGTRCTYDFDAHEGVAQGWYRCYLDTTARARYKAQLKFQRKGNKVPGTDANRGVEPGGEREMTFHHGSKVYLDGGRNYLAERGLDVKKILDEDPEAAVIFYPEGMTIDEAIASVGDPE